MMLIVQTVGAQGFFSSASDFARLYIGVVEPQYQTAQWHDIPYYKGTTDLYKGRVCYDGVVYDDVHLRFDQLEQRVVVLSPVGSVVCVPQQEHIDWFEMDGHRYVHEGARYAAVLCDGKGTNGNAANGIQLYHSVWKVYNGEKLLFGEKNTLRTAHQLSHRAQLAVSRVPLPRIKNSRFILSAERFYVILHAKFVKSSNSKSSNSKLCMHV